MKRLQRLPPTVSLPGLCCGVDEAGRGPLAGPVFAAAVILDPQHPIEGLADSKQLSEARRDFLAVQIRTHALAWSIAQASATEIDQHNILQATWLAMQRAVEGLQVRPAGVLVDGNRAPAFGLPVQCIVQGDVHVAAISAASILAKTARDAVLVALHAAHPAYGFDRHKGYPTAAHRAVLARLGPCPEHRRSFAPVRAVLGMKVVTSAVAQHTAAVPIRPRADEVS